MKYIVFASCILVDTLSQKGVEEFIEEANDFHCMTINDEEDYLLALKKVERYGSFIFVNEDKYDLLVVHSSV